MGIVILLYGLLEENNKYKYKMETEECDIQFCIIAPTFWRNLLLPSPWKKSKKLEPIMLCLLDE
jgi:hypothetical protein